MFPNCQQSGYVLNGKELPFCTTHHKLIIDQHLCSHCFSKMSKDEISKGFNTCSNCFREAMTKKHLSEKQKAVDEGRCSNYKHCSAIATKKGGMCEKCYALYIKHLQELSKQKAIDEGKCTNFMYCSAPAMKHGGMCEHCYMLYLKKHHIVSDLPQTSKISSDSAPVIPSVTPSTLDFPAMSGQTRKQAKPICWVKPTEHAPIQQIDDWTNQTAIDFSIPVQWD